MDSLVEVNSLEERLEGVGEKRLLADDGDVLTEASSPKKMKEGNRGSVFVVQDVKRVADMVLLLAAMGKMRGGRIPTEAEKELMTEARNNLVKICQEFAPKDVFPWDAFGGVIEDLGLNKLKEQRLGFRPPKLSISEKLLISKRKMEKAEDFSLPTTEHSSQYFHGNSSVPVESHTALYPGRTSELDKSIHVPISHGTFQPAFPLAHGAASTSTSLSYQLPTSEIRSIGTSTLPSSHLGSVASPRVDRPHLRSDGRLNGSLQSSQVQAARTPTWSFQPQSILSSKTGDNRVPINMSLKVEGAVGNKSGVVPQTRSVTVATQNTPSPPVHGTNHGQPPLGSTHAEIGKIVQKLLHPRGFEWPTWNPPSREYMNKAITCQICMSTMTEIDNVLICDGCEKGYHLKCLQTVNQKGIPRGEWHCGKCLSLSNGKSLPPKYGRVMRNVTTPKVPSNSATVSSSLNAKCDASDPKAAHQNPVNANNLTQNVSTDVDVDISGHNISVTQGENATEMQEDDVNSSKVRANNQLSSGDNLKSASVLGNSMSINVGDEKLVEIKPNPLAKFEMVSHLSGDTGMMVNIHDGNINQSDAEARQLTESHNNHLLMADSKKLKEQEISDNPVELIGIGKPDGSLLHVVDWVGDPIQILDEKIYYSSCCIDGHIYRAMDHVLIRFDNEKHIPSRLQAMWEDNRTTTKLVTVNRCYFPNDLPLSVGRPCGLESGEVYESSCAMSMMAGLIESPCLVLPPRKFAEESERRNVAGMHLCLPPLYLCKWIYDEAKGLFRDISC